MNTTPEKSPSVPVLITVDAIDLINDHPNPSQNHQEPTPIQNPSNYIHILTHKRISVTEDAEGIIKCIEGDTIAWKAANLSLDKEYHVLLYEWRTYDDNVFHYITRPEFKLDETTLTTQNPYKKWEMFGKVTIDVGEWATQAIRPTPLDYRVQYHFYIAIYDKNRNLKGYFWWDPFIIILPR